MHRIPSASPGELLRSGRPITLRGAGHSCGGQTVTDGELLVTYAPDAYARDIRDLGEGLIEVPSGASWHALERHLNQRGRSVPVLPNYLHMSVGGTLSVGGIGVTSVRHGMQTDHIERIRLIDGTGTGRWCSRTAHPELFRFALGGLGTVGLIERIVLRSAPYRRFAHVHRTRHRTLAELVEHTERIARSEDVDIYWASVRRHRFRSATGWTSDEPVRCATANCSTAPDLPFTWDREPERTADRVRLWTDYLVPVERLAPMVAAVEEYRLRPPLDRARTMLYLLIVRRPADAVPFAFAPAATTPVSIGVGVYTWVDRDPSATAAVRGVFRDLLERCCELGGRPYLYGADELDDALAGRLYGADLSRLRRLRSAHRLDHVNAHLGLARAARAG
ncbi:FAD-binding protein [Nocardia wallacei]|uniref:FAD-binding protein n=1 Tax=Nocardia wallacei TaxID=480035 RepID=UPI002457FE66|nr:FAD-binding protein [Nocardia wallacei]